MNVAEWIIVAILSMTLLLFFTTILDSRNRTDYQITGS